MNKFCTLILFSVCLFVSSCNREINVSVSGLTLVINDKTMYVGETVRLEATIIPHNATVQDVLWASNNNSIATVSAEGIVTAKAKGHAVINAVSKDGGHKDLCNVTVIEKEPESVNVTGIQWDEEGASTCTRSIQKGSTFTLAVKILPNNATNKNIVWDSSNESIAAVSQEGVVVAKSPGDVVISATAQDGGYKATCNLNVFELVKGISLNETSIVLKEYEQKLLIATITPDDATDKSIIWASSDESIATVNMGIVMANKAGKCAITASTKDGVYSARCDVEVTCPIESIELSDHALSMKVGENSLLLATLIPERATNKTIIWSSSDNAVASVSNSGLVTALKAGKAVITATSDDNASISAACEIDVISPVSAIAIKPESLDIYKGDGQTLSVEFTPADATNTEVNWRSNDTAIATVSADGVVRGVSAGSTDVYAISKDGGNVALCHVTVYDHVSGVELYYDGKLVGEGEQLSVFANTQVAIDAVLQPQATILNRNVIWTSSDNAVLVRFEGDSYFTARAAGVAVLTATAEDGGAKATCSVRVGEHVTSVEVSPASISEDFFVGDSKVLSAKVLPEASLYKTVKWSSEDENKVGVTDNGDGTARITAKAKGSVYVYAVSEDGGIAGKCQVVVSSSAPNSISIIPTSAHLYKGESRALSVQILPTGADASIKWSSSDENVAKVDESGLVTAVNSGKAIIKVTSLTNPAVFAECTITVSTPVTGIEIDLKELNLLVGQMYTLNASILPADADNKSLEWMTSNLSVAKVDSDGHVRAISSGEVIIAARSVSNPNVKAECRITVSDDITKFVYATYNGGSIHMVNGLIQYGSNLYFGVQNKTIQPILVKSVQLIDGETGKEGNVMSINSSIASYSNTVWSITVGLLGIHSPSAVFVYSYDGKDYECRAQYKDFSSPFALYNVKGSEIITLHE